MNRFIFRKAEIADVNSIVATLNPFAEQEIVLPRTHDDVTEFIDNFLVIQSFRKVIACVALRDFSNGLEEIRSLAVNSNYQGQRLGSMLIEFCIGFARERNTKYLFALTMRPSIFLNLAFKKVDKNIFPQKVWADCSICSKKDSCDEVAVELNLENKLKDI